MIEGITFNPPPLLFIIIGAIVGMAIGWAIGFFDSNRRTSQKIEAAETKAERAVSEAEQKIAAARTEAEVVNVTDDPGLLRLTQRAGQPFLEMDGSALHIKSVGPEQKKRLIELLTYIRPWVEGGQPAQSINPPPLPPAVQTNIAVTTPSSTQPLPPAAKSAEEKNIRSLSIVAQIDTVLQAQLLDTPLASRGIRLTESPLGGVEVYVGLNKYASIDDVPDAVIQKVIREVLSEL
jgi:hypothetical protein